MIQQAVKALQDHQLVLLEGIKSSAVIFRLDSPQALEKLGTILKPTFEQSVVLVGEIGLIYNYVEKLPEIALDIVEYAEKPIDMIYPKGKNLPAELLSEQQEVKIRLLQQGPLNQLLFKMGKALAFCPVNEQQKAQLLPVVENTLSLQLKDLDAGMKAYRTMKVEMDGEVKFY